MEQIDDYVNQLRKYHPDIFKALPLPESLARQWSVPLPSEEITSINSYMKDYMKIQNIHCQEKEVKNTCVIQGSDLRVSEGRDGKGGLVGPTPADRDVDRDLDKTG